LAIARGLMGMPKLLMLDEPSFGIEPKTVHKIFEIIKEMKDQVAILLVEQDFFRALNVCDDAYLIEAGRIKLKGDEFLTSEYARKTYLGI